MKKILSVFVRPSRYLLPRDLQGTEGAIEFAPGQVIAHEAAFRLSAVMNAAMQEYVPKVKISSTPEAHRETNEEPIGSSRA